MKKIIIFLMLCTLSSMVSCGMDIATSVDYIDESTSETTINYIKENDMNSMICKNDAETVSKNTTPKTTDIAVNSETSANEASNVNTKNITKEELAIKDTEDIKNDEMTVDDSNDFIETEQQIILSSIAN